MAEKPILFSSPMIRAILAGTKTQTRRIVKHRFDHLNMEPWLATGRVLTNLPAQPGAFMEFRYRQQDEPGFSGSPASSLVPCPYGQPGDRLWVRETWAQGWTYGGGRPCTFYRATGDGLQGGPDYPRSHDPQLGASPPADMKWRPSIFMPRWASRILLEVTGIRVERLNDISEADCWAEGIDEVDGIFDQDVPEMAKRTGDCIDDARPVYACLWESINGAGAWSANPWVWCVSFRRIAP